MSLTLFVSKFGSELCSFHLYPFNTHSTICSTHYIRSIRAQSPSSFEKPVLRSVSYEERWSRHLDYEVGRFSLLNHDKNNTRYLLLEMFLEMLQ